MRVYQLGHGVIPGDAVTTQTLEIDRRLRGWGLETEIFAHHIAPEFRHLARPDSEFAGHLDREGDLLIYQYSLYTPNVAYFRAFRGPKILIYHNITPARFFRGWDARQARLCAMGRRALSSLSSASLGLGVSEYNRRELIEAGFPLERTGVLPNFLQVDSFDKVSVSSPLLEQLRAGDVVNFLTVGRVVPNKAIEDVIRIFHVYNHSINPRSHLYIVGSRYLPAYDEEIDDMVEALNLSDVVTLTGRVSLSDLKTYYEAAHVYLTASYHEGFCVPLIESMYFGVPILARNAAAIPETLGQAGVLFDRLGYVEVAEMAHLLATDADVRAQVIATQRFRLRDFSPELIEGQLWATLQRVSAIQNDVAPRGPSEVKGRRHRGSQEV
jgi:glycosyltransferase involved in cell wall biosynthesis